MAKYKSVVITNAGLELVASTHSGGTIQFTAIKAGNGTYDGTEVLEDMTDLKSVQQTFGISGLTRDATVVKVRSVLSNEGLTEGYYMTEIGLYALVPETEAEILYAVLVADDNMADYFSPFEDSPQSMTLEVYVEAAGLAEGVTFSALIIPGTYATVQDLEDYRTEVSEELEDINKSIEEGKKILSVHIDNKDNPHNVTKEKVGLGNVPNVATNDQEPTYTEASELSELTTGEKLSIAFGKIAKAIKSLISHIGDVANPHKVTKSQVGLGNVENKTSEAIRSEITSANVTNALGYTPLNSTLKGANSGLAELDANGKVLTSQLPSYVDDVLEYSSKSAFPTTGESGKIYIATDTNLQYRWSGSAYAEISSSLALGETSSTAYRGDRGATAYAHSQKTSGNPHGVTKSDVGLGNVPNVATNDQTPTYTMASANATLVSGENMSTAFGKIAKAISSFISHLTASNPHSVTKTQVGLGNCDNTADADKPISTAVQDEFDNIKRDLSRQFIKIDVSTDSGNPILEYYGKICILQYTNVNWEPGQTIPEGYRPQFNNKVWASVSSSKSNDDYRMYVDTSGVISLQCNGVDLTSATNVRGQVMWIIP